MMKNLTSKKKYKLLKVTGIFLDLFTIFALTFIGVLLEWDNLWGNIDEEGIVNFYQWFSLVFYRLTLYLLPGFILSICIFDKRYKYISRLKIWLNWTLCIYLIGNSVIKVFAIDKIFKFSIFNNIDVVVLLVGYVITFATKEKVSFDSTEAIINPKGTN